MNERADNLLREEKVDTRRRVDDMRWRVVSVEFVAIMVTMCIQIGGMFWWASGVEHRIQTIEDSRNTQAMGDVRDIRIQHLEDIAEQQQIVHATMNRKVDNLATTMASIATSVAVIAEQAKRMDNNGNGR